MAIPSPPSIIEGDLPAGAVISSEFPTGPIDEGGAQYVERPIMPGSISIESGDGKVITVPGPESAPMPAP